MKLFVGLGNPGREYALTRHNLGFQWIDQLAAAHGAVLRQEARFHGQAGKLTDAGGECWLLKPTTYMNDSGRSVQAMMQFFKIEPPEVLVVHDELDLPPGEVKLKKGGGSAGHNGLKDIAVHLGPDFWRLRLGIGRPADRARMIDYVLEKPAKSEIPIIQLAIERSLEIWPMLKNDKAEAAMLKLHTKT
ncbi:MAG: aminoacyl-tRNA hydrolase [Burkholderiales bacterium]